MTSLGGLPALKGDLPGLKGYIPPKTLATANAIEEEVVKRTEGEDTYGDDEFQLPTDSVQKMSVKKDSVIRKSSNLDGI